jgi:imidazolonepropionase-like amidohydrolase
MAPAKMLGIDNRVGSLEVGKDADIALFNGDPFEYTTNVVGTIIDGERVSNTVR